MIIHLGLRLLSRSCDLPGSARHTNVTTEADDLHDASLFGLAPQGVCLAVPVARHAGDAFTSPFHHRPRITVRAVCSLLHFSVGVPRLAVSQPAVLRCSDFPPALLRVPAITRSTPSLPAEYITPDSAARVLKRRQGTRRRFSLRRSVMFVERAIPHRGAIVGAGLVPARVFWLMCPPAIPGPQARQCPKSNAPTERLPTDVLQLN